MKKFIITIISFLLISCSGIRVSNGIITATVDKPEKFCDIKKVDPNCKVEDVD